MGREEGELYIKKSRFFQTCSFLTFPCGASVILLNFSMDTPFAGSLFNSYIAPRKGKKFKTAWRESAFS